MHMIQSKPIVLSGINVPWFEIRPLVYDPKSNHFPPNTTIELLIKNLMIEQWNPSYSYKQFYESCAPNYCTYSQRIRTKTSLGIIITLVSMIGGLTVSLRLITPFLVKFIYFLFELFIKRHEQVQERGIS